MRHGTRANLRGDEQKRHMRLNLWPSYHDLMKACDASGRVNDALVQRKLKSLSGEIWLACGSSCLWCYQQSEACLTKTVQYQWLSIDWN